MEIGKALGVHYVVAGTVRKLGQTVRLNVSLAETERGQLVWSDRIQRPFDEILDVIDEITARVAATVAGRIEQAELAAARLKRPENMSAYEYYLIGLEHHRLIGVADHHIAEAMQWFERSMEADAGFARPVTMHVCAQASLASFDKDLGEKQVAHALELDPADPESHRVMGSLKMMGGDFTASRHHHDRALEMAPNDAYMIGRCAAFYTFAGEPERALALLDRAEALDPFLPVWITEERVAALYALKRYDEMFCRRSLPAIPDPPHTDLPNGGTDGERRERTGRTVGSAGTGTRPFAVLRIHPYPGIVQRPGDPQRAGQACLRGWFARGAGSLGTRLLT